MTILILYFLCLGAIIGSFANMLIYRLPRNLSIVTPRSRCPKCGHQLSWFENLPLLSYLRQKGRCYHCHGNIAIRYLLVEVIFSFFFVFAFYNYSFLNLKLFLILSIITLFLLIVFIDLDSQIIPDSLNFLLLIFLPIYTKSYLNYKQALFSGMIAVCLPLSITYIYYKISGKIGLGGGDMKLYGVIGVALGIKGFFINIFLSSFIGSIIMLFLIAIKQISRDKAIAFGPFIVLVLSFQIFFPELLRNCLVLLGL